MTEHDWIIRFVGDPVGPAPLTDHQRKLLADMTGIVARETKASAERQQEIFERLLAPLIRDLHASGLSPKRIADHSMIRPQGVESALRADSESGEG